MSIPQTNSFNRKLENKVKSLDSSIPPPALKKRKNEPEKDTPIDCPIQVYIRCRGPESVLVGKKIGIEASEENNEVSYKEGTSERYVTRPYSFNRVFGPAASQKAVYDEIVSPMIDEVLSGYSCTLFAYGQTGTGKTHTMEGKLDEVQFMPSGNSGIIPRTLYEIFEKLESDKENMSLIKVSMIEIYNEEVYDLLGANEPGTELSKLILIKGLEKDLVIKGLAETVITNPSEGVALLEKGAAMRHTASTKLNKSSSRSHCIYTLKIKINSKNGDEKYFTTGKLHLVDLAGSEDISRSGAEKAQAAEAGKINRSLLTLGQIIKDLSDRSSSKLNPNSTGGLTFRNSKLTRILEDSLGGGTKTRMIATVSLLENDLKESINTIKYASQAMSIKNRPRANISLGEAALYLEYKTEYQKMAASLKAQRDKDGAYLANDVYEKLTNGSKELEFETKRLNSEINELQQINSDLSNKFEENKKELILKDNELNEKTNELETTKIHLETSNKKLEEALLKIETLKRQNDAYLSSEAQLDKVARDLLDTTIMKSKQLEDLFKVVSDKYRAAETNMKFANELLSNTSFKFEESNSRLQQLSKSNLEFKNGINSVSEALRNSLTIKSADITSNIKNCFEQLNALTSTNKDKLEDNLGFIKSSVRSLATCFHELTGLIEKQTLFTCDTLDQFSITIDQNNSDFSHQIEALGNEFNVKVNDMKQEYSLSFQKKTEEYDNQMEELKKEREIEVQKLRAQYEWSEKLLKDVKESEALQRAKVISTMENALKEYSSYHHSNLSNAMDKHLSMLHSREAYEENVYTKFTQSLENSNNNYQKENKKQGLFLEDTSMTLDKYRIVSLEYSNNITNLTNNNKNIINKSHEEMKQVTTSNKNQYNDEINTCHSHIDNGNKTLEKHLEIMTSTLKNLQSNHVTSMSHLNDSVNKSKDNLVGLAKTHVDESVLPEIIKLSELNNTNLNLTTTFVNEQFMMETSNPDQFNINTEEYPKEWPLINPQDYVVTDINEIPQVKEEKSESSVTTVQSGGEKLSEKKSIIRKDSNLKNGSKLVQPIQPVRATGATGATGGPIRSTTFNRQTNVNRQPQRLLARSKTNSNSSKKSEPRK